MLWYVFRVACMLLVCLSVWDAGLLVGRWVVDVWLRTLHVGLFMMLDVYALSGCRRNSYVKYLFGNDSQVADSMG